MKLNYVFTENGNIKANEKGFPIVIDDDEKEMGLDAIGLYSKIPNLQREAKEHRLNAKEIKEKLSKYEELNIDVDNFSTWRADAEKAISTLENIDASKLIEADKVGEIKSQITTAYEEKIKSLTNESLSKLSNYEKLIQQKQGQINQLMISDKFNSSPFIKEKLTLPPRVAKKYFADNFKVETIDGELKTVGYLNGEQIYSKENIGELADFNEALKIMVDSDPDKDDFIKTDIKSGSGGGETQKSVKSPEPELKGINAIAAGLRELSQT